MGAAGTAALQQGVALQHGVALQQFVLGARQQRRPAIALSLVNVIPTIANDASTNVFVMLHFLSTGIRDTISRYWSTQSLARRHSKDNNLSESSGKNTEGPESDNAATTTCSLASHSVFYISPSRTALQLSKTRSYPSRRCMMWFR